MEHPSTSGHLRRSPGLLLGPYYPARPPRHAGHVLWTGERTPPGTRQLVLSGRCVNVGGAALRGVLVELWHADSNGRYPHPSAPHSALVLPGFSGYGTARTRMDGAFRFDSLVPAGYADGQVTRAPHLHVQLTGRFDRLVTQLFLPGEGANAVDPWFAGVASGDSLVPRVVRDTAQQLHVDWTAVLTQG